MSREAADFYFLNDLFNEKMRSVKMGNYLTKSQNLKKTLGPNMIAPIIVCTQKLHFESGSVR